MESCLPVDSVFLTEGVSKPIINQRGPESHIIHPVPLACTCSLSADAPCLFWQEQRAITTTIIMMMLCAQAGARALSRELASPPIEVVLVEGAVAIIRHCRPPGSAESGQPVAQVVPAAVLSFLRRRVIPARPSCANILLDRGRDFHSFSS